MTPQTILAAAGIRLDLATVLTMEIHPALAEVMLQLNTDNRPLNSRTVTRYAQDMEAGAWKPVSQGIGFDVNGRLTNGQHRLAAIVKSQTTLPFAIFTGLPEESFAHEDQGRTRTVGDLIAVSHPEKANRLILGSTLTSMLKGLHDVEVSKTDILDAVGVLSPIVEPLVSVLSKNPLARRAPLIAAFANAARTTDPCAGPRGNRRYDLVEAAAQRLGNTMFSSVGDPMRALHARLLRNDKEGRASGTKLSGPAIYAISVSALRAALAAKNLAKVEATTVDWGEQGDTIRAGTGAVIKK